MIYSDWLVEQKRIYLEAREGHATVDGFVDHLIDIMAKDPVTGFNEQTAELLFASGLKVRIDESAKWLATGGFLMEDETKSWSIT